MAVRALQCQWKAFNVWLVTAKFYVKPTSFPSRYLHKEHTSQMTVTVQVKRRFMIVLLQWAHHTTTQLKCATPKLVEMDQMRKTLSCCYLLSHRLFGLLNTCKSFHTFPSVPYTQKSLSFWQSSYLQLRRHRWLLSPERSTTACHLQVLQRERNKSTFK